MNTDDRSDENAPGSSPGDPFLHPDWAPESDREPTRAPQIAHRSILGGLAGEWRRILLAWLVVAAPVGYLIFRFVEPTYKAMSLLRAEPRAIDLYGPGQRGTPDPGEVRSYLETQIQLLRSDRVLDAAITKPRISNLPMIRESRDPKADLRKEMRVSIVGLNTYLIEVALRSRDPEEAAAIVNAVVDAHIEQHSRYQRAANKDLKDQLTSELSKLKQQINTKQKELEQLVAKGNIAVVRQDKAFHTVTEEQYKFASNRLIQVDFELMDAEARLETARLPKGQASAEKIRELESAVEEAKRKRDRYRDYLATLEVKSTTHNTEQIRAQMVNQELDYLRRLSESVEQRLKQVEFETTQEAYRISVQDKAEAPRVPVDQRRLVYMGGASVALLFLVFGWFLTRELTIRTLAA